MQNLKGGIKYTNIKTRTEATKAKWIIKLLYDPNLRVNKQLYNRIIGNQRGNYTGEDMIFRNSSYINRSLNIKTIFYKEALQSHSRYLPGENILSSHLH